MPDITVPAVTEADLFPFTCEWCRNSPATHLLITDMQPTGKQATTRHEAKVCGPCAHRVTVLPPSFVGWWLFRLVPDNCEEN